MNSSSEVERALAELWARVLDVDEVAEEANFLELGGQSIAAVTMLTHVRDRFGLEPDLPGFLRNPTLRVLIDRVEARQQRRGSAAPSITASTSRSKPQYSDAPLSFGQEQLLILDRLQPGNPAYHVPVGLDLGGTLNWAAIKTAHSQVLDRHEVLRTTIRFSNGVPQQTRGAGTVDRLHLIDLRGLELQSAVLERDRWTTMEAARSFDLERGPLFRVSILQLSSDLNRILMVGHHFVCDRWSLEVLIHELAALYNMLRSDGTAKLPGLDFQYADFAIRQRQEFAGHHDQLIKATERLKNVPPLELPGNRNGTARRKTAGGRVRFKVPASGRQALAQLATRCETTLFTTLLAGFVILLHRYSGQRDFAIGTPSAARNRHELESQVGFYVNTLVLRSGLSEISDGETVASLIRNLRDEALSALEQAALPFEKVVEALHPDRDLHRNPIFQAMFSWRDRAGDYRTRELAALFQGLRLQAHEVFPGAPHVDLTLSLADTADELIGFLDYDARRLQRSIVESMAFNLREILLAFGPTGEITLDELPCPSGAEREGLLQSASTGPPRSHISGSISEEFEHIAHARPDRVAATAGEVQITLGELNRRANALAHHLRLADIGPEAIVGLLMDRSIEMLIAILGILKAGAAYLPLATDLPELRLRMMTSDVRPVAVVAHRSLAAIAERITEKVIMIDALQGEHAWDEDLPVKPMPNQLAYLIFTSGSTGRPKAVMLEHRQVLQFFAGMDATVGPATGPWLATTALAFDISVLELLWTLCGGAQVVVADIEERRGRTDPAASSARQMAFSLFFFGADANEATRAYGLMLDAARFADEHGFTAVWTPERHFHRFGGTYPNPSVTSAAIAAVTKRVGIRAGSVVLPLHDPLRIAEEWALVDNLSNGRVGVSFASGWHPNDFILAPKNWRDRKDVMRLGIDEVRRLWCGKPVTRLVPGGASIEVRSLPRPVQSELPIWVTAAGNVDTFRLAGELGTSVLTHLLGQNLEELGEKIQEYRRAWRDHGWEGEGHVTLMLHACVGDDLAQVRKLSRNPLREYLATSLDLARGLAGDSELESNSNVRAGDTAVIVDRALARFLQSNSLIGDNRTCLEMIGRAASAGVDEIACLIDFGLDSGFVLQGLEGLAEVRRQWLARSAMSPAASLGTLMKEHQVTGFQCTPSVANSLLDDDDAVEGFAHLERMLVGGEAFPGRVASRLSDFVKELYNVYGPTETTVWATVERLLEIDAQDSAAPIGLPIPGTEVYVTDSSIRLSPRGVIGELCIGGAGVSRGYANRPDLSAERFVPNPFSSEPGARLYRTGDLARWRHDGRLEFLGRIDDQIKLRGHRIELGEIRAAISRHPGIRECYVTFESPALGGGHIAAWIVPSSRLTSVDLQRFLKDHLPAYMLPAEITFLETLPLTRNGKIDRSAIHRGAGMQATKAEYDEPQTPTEALVAEAFRDVLQHDRISVRDNFFQLGGHSLLAMQVIFRIRRDTGLPLSLESIFEAQTIRELAQLIDTLRSLPMPTHASATPRAGQEEIRL